MAEALTNRTTWTVISIVAGWILTIGAWTYSTARDDGASHTVQLHHGQLLSDHEKRIRANEAARADMKSTIETIRVDLSYIKASIQRIEHSLDTPR